PVSQKEAQSLKSEAFSSIAQLHLDNSDSIQAEEYLQKAIETMPYNFPALLKSALIAFNQDDRSHALNRLKQIASLPEEIRPPLQSITKANRSTNWTSLVNEAHK
ncbi:MAG: hypothetical protein HN457_08380, partial [Opitutales bacterium]|nr:hypothetical protein [Opitutales bacterium]